VLRGAGTNATALLDGFTVTGGNANLSSQNNDRGGAILCIGTQSPTIRRCRFVANRCTFGGGVGYVGGSGTAPTFTDCSFEDNFGGSFGGAFDIAQAGAVRFERCVFRGNTAGRAGALEIFATSGVVVSNSLFVGNTSTSGTGGGGALWLGSGGTTQVKGCTIVANSSTSQTVAGVRVQTATVVVANCILWDNAGPGGAQGAANQIGGTGATYSIVEGGLAGAGNLALDPQFVDPLAGDYSLAAASPAIDAGDNGAVPAGTTLDLALEPRFADDPAAADTGAGTAPIVDIGAHERSGIVPPTFCDASDGALASCPCAPGAPGAGCDLPQSTGGVALAVLGQTTSPNGATLSGTGFPVMASPTAIVIRSTALDPSAPVVLGDGLRCVSTASLVRLAATKAVGGMSTHVFGHGAGPGAGTFYYQIWFRSTPSTYCDPSSAFNLSNGRVLTW
jgi:hypothetical protein